MERSEMLDDYFSLEIDDDGHLLSLPMLVDGYVPYFGALPYYILRLATEVNWGDEENCFDTFCAETAKFYAVKTDENARFDAEQHLEKAEQAESDERWKQSVELLFAAFKRSAFNPPKSALDDMTFVQVANLPDLYRVFERC
jgi:DNA mismatch repair protein MLH1